MANTFTVVRSITVRAEPAELFARLQDFRRWRAWSPFEQLDPDMDRTYQGAAWGAGAIYEWSGNMKAGAGRLELVSLVPEAQVVVEQRNTKPMKTTSTSTFVLKSAGAGRTTVSWTMTGPLRGPARIVGAFKSMDSLIGPLFEQGLTNLKVDAEAGDPAAGVS